MDTSNTLFQNARLTNDPTNQLYDVHVQDSIISSITPVEVDGPADSFSTASRVVDLHGSYIAPSMVDNHVHFSVWAKARKRVSLADVTTLQAALEILRAAASSFDESQAVLIGVGLHLGAWSSEDITQMRKAILDKALPTHIPVMVIMNDLHSSWCNSSMLDLLGFDPASRLYDGLLLELDCFNSMVKIDALQANLIWDDLCDASIDAAKKGITEIVDLDIDRNLINWPLRVQKGLRYLRVHCGVYPQHFQDAVDLGLGSGEMVPGGEGLVSVGPFKVISDGSLGTRTACCHAAYPAPPAPPGDYGLLNYTEEVFETMFQSATAQKLRLAVHAIGDKTHTVVLNVMQRMKEPPLPGSTIEHAQLVLWEDLKKFRDLGLAASVQPQHLNDDRELAERFWPTCTHRAFPYLALANAGIALKLGSDAPVAPLDPWMAMAAGISRCRPGETEGWHPEQRISIKLAYQASTSGGRLQVKAGDVADICILDKDPLTASVDEVRDMKVQATMLGGRFTWDALNRHTA